MFQLPLAVFSLQTEGIPVSIFVALVGVAFAVGLIRSVVGASPGNERMREIAGAIEEGAKAYLNRQIFSVTRIAIVLFVVVGFAKDWVTAAGFLLGAGCSMAAGFCGMRIAVLANVRTAQGATVSRHKAMQAAFNGGAVTGLLVVGLALLSVASFYLGVARFAPGQQVGSLVGVALGASLISVFARLGGGIYTKAADVGADLVGKIESNLDEDDPRNPATIADNVGDNVGDCAGMAADVFETYAVSLIGAVLVGALTMKGAQAAVVFPFLLGAISLLSSIVGVLFVNWSRALPATSLMAGVGVSGVLSACGFYFLTNRLFPTPVFSAGKEITATGLYVSALIGLGLTAAVVLITNYYTSTAYSPVRKIARASQTGHATNIIAGLAMGQHATALPVILIGASIWLSFHYAGLYGVAVAVMSMLSLAGIIVSLDAFGPITDNAGGIAVMSGLPKEVRAVTDDLDAVGNTMKAVTKGYAVASAGLAALVLFGSYAADLKDHLLEKWHHSHLDADAAALALQAEQIGRDLSFSLSDPGVLIGLFLGGLLPFMFAALSMDAVGKAAGAVVNEVRRQLAERPGILKGEAKPDYGVCVDIVTQAALREMILPALLPVLAVIAVAALPGLGRVVLGGVLVGTIVTGLFVAISMTSSGGAWDNAKKYIEEGHFGGKGSPAHQAAVTGDTVGDPYKDTSGPAINPMIKVVNIVAILIIPVFF